MCHPWNQHNIWKSTAKEDDPFPFWEFACFQGQTVCFREDSFLVSERNRDPRTMMFFFEKGATFRFFLENAKQEKKRFKQHEWHRLLIWEDGFYFLWNGTAGGSFHILILISSLIDLWMKDKIKRMGIWCFTNFHLAGGFKYFLFSPLLGEDEPILTHIFEMGWFNHQLVMKSGLREKNGVFRTFCGLMKVSLWKVKVFWQDFLLLEVKELTRKTRDPAVGIILLLEEIPNNHLGWC